MPLLQSQKLWDRSGRSKQAGPEVSISPIDNALVKEMGANKYLVSSLVIPTQGSKGVLIAPLANPRRGGDELGQVGYSIGEATANQTIPHRLAR
jgi:hypothetical protein